MPTTIQIRATFEAATNISRDNVSNTFCFMNPAPGIDNFDNPLDMIQDLYCVAAPGSTAALGSHINNSMKRTARLAVYDLDDPSPRAPKDERFITLPNTIGGYQECPAEVALCVSFQGTRESGVNQDRRRGRIFLGPLAVPTGSMRQPPAQLLANVNAQFQKFKDESDASYAWQWRVWSPTNGNSVLVDNGWVDNAWDTQRRRGPRATARTAFL